MGYGGVVLGLVARSLVFGVLGVSSAFFANSFLMGALAILAGPILLHHLRSQPRGTASARSEPGRSPSTR